MQEAEATEAEGAGHGDDYSDDNGERDEDAGQAGEDVNERGRERAGDGVDEPEDEVKQGQRGFLSIAACGWKQPPWLVSAYRLVWMQGLLG